jgi:FSR family fosmidomycin resistance protein-like MFS transporter
MSRFMRAHLRRVSWFVFFILVIEFLDEFIFGYQGAALPIIRQELNLNYIQIGLLFTIPDIVATCIEPFIGILGDTKWRKTLIILGGIGFAIAVFAYGISVTFIGLLFATILFFPSSGAFIGMAESALMDSDPSRHEQNMARWTFAGSLGVVVGSLTLGFVAQVGVSWRIAPIVLAVITLLVVLAIVRYRFMPNSDASHDDEEDDEEEPMTFRQSFTKALQALRRIEVVRWLVLLEFSDLMTDILFGYLALYFVDVVGLGNAEAALAVAVWTTVGLVGDFALIFLLERVKGLVYLRYSIMLEFVLYIAFLLVPSFTIKLIILGFLGFFNAGWYAILKGELYSVMPGQSSTIITLTNIVGIVATVIPLVIGIVAENFGLGVAMWMLLAGPIALYFGIPWRKRATTI